MIVNVSGPVPEIFRELLGRVTNRITSRIQLEKSMSRDQKESMNWGEIKELIDNKLEDEGYDDSISIRRIDLGPAWDRVSMIIEKRIEVGEQGVGTETVTLKIKDTDD